MNKFDRLRDHSFIPKFSEDSVILDLGGLCGEFSKLFSQKYPYRKIIIIEANPNLIKKIKDNLQNIPNVEIINAVICADDVNEVIFNINTIDLEASSKFTEFAEIKGFKENTKKIEPNIISIKDTEKVKVKTTSLKEIYKKHNLSKIDLVKMDVEGAEWDIFEKFDKEDYDIIEQISVEFHDFFNPKYKKRSEACIKKLENFGYNFKHKQGFWGYGTPYVDCIFYK